MASDECIEALFNNNDYVLDLKGNMKQTLALVKHMCMNINNDVSLLYHYIYSIIYTNVN